MLFEDVQSIQSETELAWCYLLCRYIGDHVDSRNMFNAGILLGNHLINEVILFVSVLTTRKGRVGLPLVHSIHPILS